MDLTHARRLLDRLLAETGYARVSDAEFSKALTDPDLQAASDFSPTPEDDFAQEAARAIRFARRLGGGVSRRLRRRVGTPDQMAPVAAPPWWEAESTRRLSEFLRERALMRQDAGLFRLTPWHEASSEDEPARRVDNVDEMMGEPSDEALAGTGRFAGLRQVSRIEPLIERLELENHREVARIVREGRDPEVDYPDIDPDDFIEDEVLIEYPARDWTPENPRTKSGFFVALGFTEGYGLKTSLQRVHNRSIGIAEQAGITQAEALVWGLTDVPFTIPWVGVSVSRHLWANAPWDSITLRVGSSAAVTKDIVRAYQLACGRGWTESGQKTRAPRGPWRMRVVAFVDRQRGLNPKATWGDIFDAFVTEWPDQPYGSMRSFRQAFYLGQRTTERSTP